MNGINGSLSDWNLRRFPILDNSAISDIITEEDREIFKALIVASNIKVLIYYEAEEKYENNV